MERDKVGADNSNQWDADHKVTIEPIDMLVPVCEGDWLLTDVRFPHWSCRVRCHLGQGMSDKLAECRIEINKSRIRNRIDRTLYSIQIDQQRQYGMRMNAQ